MTTIAGKLQSIYAAKGDIADAITSKGVPASVTDPLSSFSDKIASIPSGGTGVLPLGMSFPVSAFPADDCIPGEAYIATLESDSEVFFYNLGEATGKILYATEFNSTPVYNSISIPLLNHQGFTSMAVNHFTGDAYVGTRAGYVFKIAGTSISLQAGTASSPSHVLGNDLQGNFYYIHDGMLERVTPSGVIEDLVTGIDPVIGDVDTFLLKCAVDSFGKYWIPLGNKIAVISPTGTVNAGDVEEFTGNDMLVREINCINGSLLAHDPTQSTVYFMDQPATYTGNSLFEPMTVSGLPGGRGVSDIRAFGDLVLFGSRDPGDFYFMVSNPDGWSVDSFSVPDRSYEVPFRHVPRAWRGSLCGITGNTTLGLLPPISLANIETHTLTPSLEIGGDFASSFIHNGRLVISQSDSAYTTTLTLSQPGDGINGASDIVISNVVTSLGTGNCRAVARATWRVKKLKEAYLGKNPNFTSCSEGKLMLMGKGETDGRKEFFITCVLQNEDICYK